MDLWVKKMFLTCLLHHYQSQIVAKWGQENDEMEIYINDTTSKS